MKPPMLHTAYLVTTTRTAYGSYTASGETALNCHVRIIDSMVTNSNNEQMDSDAMMWFEPDSNVTQGSIVKFNGKHYKVERVTEARRLRNPSVLFLKCEMSRYGIIS